MWNALLHPKSRWHVLLRRANVATSSTSASSLALGNVAASSTSVLSNANVTDEAVLPNANVAASSTSALSNDNVAACRLRVHHQFVRPLRQTVVRIVVLC